MTEPIEAELKKRAMRNRLPEPDFEAMWRRIGEREEAASGARRRRGAAFFRPRRWAMLAVGAICLAVAVPAFAAGSLRWGWFNEQAAGALEAGAGTRIDQTEKSGGVTFQLLGAVSDDYRTDLLFQLKNANLPDYDAIEFAKAELTDAQGERYSLDGRMANDTDGVQSGLLETAKPLPTGKRSYELDVKDLILYRKTIVPVALNASGSQGQQAEIGAGGIASVTIESILRENNVYTIRYRLTGSSSGVNGKAGPGLILRVDSQTMTPSLSTVLPPPASNTMLRQETYELTDEQLANAELAFSELEESSRIQAKWHFAFSADGSQAEQTIYRKPLDAASLANSSVMKFKELVVTPLEIRLNYDEERSDKWLYQDYQEATLILNGKEIEGGRFVGEDGHWYLRFLSPEWYRDWVGVPMQLRLSSLHIENRADRNQLLPLTDPSEAKQSLQTDVGGFPVRFTYYKDGADLVVESEWLGGKDGGIVQTYIMAGGKRIFAEISPEAPGGNGTNKKIETYRNVPAGELQLNPFLYHWTDKSRTETFAVQ